MSKTSGVYKHFESTVGGFTCQVNDCGTAIRDPGGKKNVCSNLKRHLKISHPDTFKEVEEEDEKTREAKKPCAQPVPVPKSRITHYFSAGCTQMSAEELKTNIIDLVVRGGVPLTTLGSEAMRNLIGEMASKVKFSLDRDSIRDAIMSAAAAKRNEIKAELRGHALFLKIDGCTRHNRSYLGVNVQFAGPADMGGGMWGRTLAVRDCGGVHSGQHTKDMLVKVMADFEITHEQVFAIVSDNAANMVKTVALFNESEGGDGDEAGEDADHAPAGDSPEGGAPDGDAPDGDALGGDAEESDMPDITAVISAAPATASHMRCAAHTLQLAVRDGIKSVTTLLAGARFVVKKLSTPHLVAVIKRRGALTPILDNDTRWSSTDRMLSRLLELRGVVEDLGAANPQLHLSNDKWQQLQHVAEALEDPTATMTRLQAAELTPGLFLKEWILLKRKL